MEKPTVKLIGENGNIFNLVGIASNALKRNNQTENAKKMKKEIFSCGSYDEALQTIMKYCEVE